MRDDESLRRLTDQAESFARRWGVTHAGPRQVGNQDMLRSLALAIAHDDVAQTHIDELRAVSRITHNANFALHADLAEVYLAHARADPATFAPRRGLLQAMPGDDPAGRLLASRLALLPAGAPADLREDRAAMTALPVHSIRS